MEESSMADRKVVDEWLRLADEDFGFAVSNLDDPATSYFAPICFHFHQAAEKYFKAFIVAHNLVFEKIHDLDVLRARCEANEPRFAESRDACLFLNDFYVETRYPIIVPVVMTREEAEGAKRAAEQIRSLVKELLVNTH